MAVGLGRGRLPLAKVESMQTKSSAVMNNEEVLVPNILLGCNRLSAGTDVEFGKVKELLLWALAEQCFAV